MDKVTVLLGHVKVSFEGVLIYGRREYTLFYCLKDRFLILWKESGTIEYASKSALSPGGNLEHVGQRIGIGVKSWDTRPVLPSPDGYRGEMSCLKINRKAGFIRGKEVPPVKGAHYAYDVVNVNTWEKVGVILHWYGNGGEGKRAASEFISAD